MWLHEDAQSAFMHNLKCGGCELREILITYGFKYVNPELHHQYKDFIFDDDKIEFDTDPHTIKNLGKYRFYYSHQVNIQEKLDTYFLFTFVRNPYDKLYSSYNYLKECMIEDNGKLLNTPDNMDYYENFNTFVKNYKNVCKRSYCHSFITQYNTLLNYSNKINFAYIGRQETLDIDIDVIKILKLLNFNINVDHSKKLYTNDRKNVSSQNNSIVDVCDEETFLFINNHFKDDFETFGYKKYESYNDFILNFVNDKTNYMNVYNKSCDEFYKNIIKLKYHNYVLSELILSYNKFNIDDINIITIETLTIINKIMNDIKIIESKILSKDEKICKRCNFKSYNFLSYHSHSLTCKS